MGKHNSKLTKIEVETYCPYKLGKDKKYDGKYQVIQITLDQYILYFTNVNFRKDEIY